MTERLKIENQPITWVCQNWGICTKFEHNASIEHLY